VPQTSQRAVDNGKRKASTATVAEHAVSAVHELYGHALLNLKGMPWEHDGGHVDARIIEIENRTRRLYETK